MEVRGTSVSVGMDRSTLIARFAAEEFRRCETAAAKIQRAWRHAASCPDFAVCRRRLLSEAAELCSS